jgi:hypothetical protein
MIKQQYIKYGNSLIDDVEIAGDKAFNWQNHSKIFEKGFDVIIGKSSLCFKEIILTRGRKIFL